MKSLVRPTRILGDKESLAAERLVMLLERRGYRAKLLDVDWAIRKMGMISDPESMSDDEIGDELMEYLVTAEASDGQ